jgi:hypothetical protein
VAVQPDSFAPHPVLACAARVAEDLTAVGEVPVQPMSAEEKAAALVAVTGTIDQLHALRLRLLAAADDVAAEAGARDAGAWLAHRTRRDRREQQGDLRLATALADRWQHLESGLAVGAVNLAQARVIARALDALPDDVPGEVAKRAEAQLVEYAAQFGPSELRVLGRRILDVVAPEVGEAAEARALEAEERRAAERTTLSLTPCGDGTTRVHGRMPDAAAHRLATYLDAFTSPRQGRHDHGDAQGPVERRRGRAFGALLEHLDPGKLPDHGGDATTVLVTMTLDQLRSELAAAGVISSDDLRISGGEARRLACNAGIIPAVLGGKSEVLDLGRTSRLYSRAQRKALRITHQRCRARGCTVPATWCEAHHLKPWALGGLTDIADGVLLCPFHHHRAHDPTYELSRCADGDIDFRRRRRR